MHKKTRIAASIVAALGISIATVKPASAVMIADGLYTMTIDNTPYSGGGFNFGTNGNWSSQFVLGCLPGSKGCVGQAMYDDTVASPVNGKYSGTPNDGVTGSINLTVSGGVITGTSFSMDTISGTSAGEFAEYTNGPVAFTGAVDSAGNMTLTPTGRLATVSEFASLVDERWNVENFNGTTTSGTNIIPNSPTSNTAWDTFTTGSACTSLGCIDGTTVQAVGATDYSVTLVSAGIIGSDFGGFFGAAYYEVWASQTTITYLGPLSQVPIPAAAWLFGSGLAGLLGVARRKKQS